MIIFTCGLRASPVIDDGHDALQKRSASALTAQGEAPHATVVWRNVPEMRCSALC